MRFDSDIEILNRVVRIEQKIGDLEKNMSASQATINALAAQVNTLSAQETANSASLTTIDTEVKALQEKVASGGTVTPDDFYALTAAISSLQNSLGANTTEIGTISTDAATPAVPTAHAKT